MQVVLRMNCICIMIGEYLFPVVYRILDEFHVDFCVMGYDEVKQPVPPYTDVVYFKHNEVLYNARYPEVGRLKPLSKELLNALIDCQVSVMDIMVRLTYDPKYNFYQHRLEMYTKHVRFWNHILDEKHIDFVLLTVVPHEVYANVIFALCKLKGIPVFILSTTGIKDNLIWIDSIDEPSLELKQRYEFVRNDPTMAIESNITLPPSLESYYQEQIDKSHDPVPFYYTIGIK